MRRTTGHVCRVNARNRIPALALFAIACTAQVHRSPPADPAPAAAPPVVAKADPIDPCDVACRPFADCEHAEACAESCRWSRERTFAEHEPATPELLSEHAEIFGRCLAGVPERARPPKEHCAAIDVAMNYGPLGWCSDEAR